MTARRREAPHNDGAPERGQYTQAFPTTCWGLAPPWAATPTARWHVRARIGTVGPPLDAAGD